ncbi:MAG TPA: hypothetical protein VMR21_17415, partial [Vicinamibacteria bacterium]|nr:hypothetical protein [Vicinamibacteria bacterium]
MTAETFTQAWDRHFFTRLVLPLLPLGVFLQTKGSAALTPELVASLAMVLGARLYADRPFRSPMVTGVVAGIPAFEGILLCSGVNMPVDRMHLAIAVYALAALGTLYA